ncbi:32724_t:CDS:2, partial [Gigaspora margarita]
QNSDQAQSKKKLFTKQNNNVQSSQSASNILQPIVPQPAFSSYDEMQKLFQAIINKQDIKHKAKIEKLKAELQAQQLQVAIVGNFQLPLKIYPIKSEKSQEAFYIVDKEASKSTVKKPQQQNQNARMDRIESKVDEIGQMISQFERIILDNQSKKP